MPTFITGDDNDDVEIKQTYISQYENMQISSILQPYPSENFNPESAEKKGNCTPTHRPIYHSMKTCRFPPFFSHIHRKTLTMTCREKR